MLFSTHPTYYPSKFMLILTQKKIKTKKSIRKNQNKRHTEKNKTSFKIVKSSWDIFKFNLVTI